MPSNGRVAGKLVVQMDLQSAGFMNSATGINKAIRSMRSNLRTLDKFYKANGDEVGRLSQKYKQSSQLMTTYKEKLKGLKSELKGLKPNTQAFVQQQNQIRRTEADMAQLSNEMRAYRKQLLYQDSALQKTNQKYKQQAAVINSSISRYKAEGNALKQSIAERRKVKNSIDQHNASIRSNEKILNRIRVVMGKNSAEYAEQRGKLRALKSETASYNAQLTQTTNKMKAMAVQQRATNSAMGRAMVGMQKNKAGLIDMRNSFMGLTAAAIGMAFPVVRAIGGAVKATVEWEDAVANVEKTIDPATDNIGELKDGIMDMAKVMPQSQAEIGNTMSMAAQLGIKGTKDLKNFTEIATQMGVATDMSAEEAAKAMARIANITGMPTKEMKNLGSTIVNLGNNMAAQEGEITNFMMRLSGTGTTVGMAEKDIAALSAAMAGVGIRAEAGGSAMSKVMSKINTAVKDGGDTMEKFAEVSGMSGQEFSTLWENDPYKAIMKFEGGVKAAVDQGENHKTLLKELGITELRETDTVLRLANGNKQLADARTHANKGWKEGTALSDEAEKKYQSLGNQMKIFMNHVRALGIEIGGALTPILKFMMKALIPVIDALASAPAPIKLLVVALGLIPVIAVPVLGSLAAITGAMGLMGQAMNTATTAAGRNSKALRIYAASVGLLTSPIATVKKGFAGLPGLFGKTGKSATGAGSRFGILGKSLRFLAPLGGLIVTMFASLAGVLAAISAPVLIAVAVIGSLVAAFVVAYKKVGWFRDGINGLLHVFKVFGGNIITGAIDKVKDFGKWVGDVAGNVGGWATDKFKSMWKAMAGTSFGKGTKKNFDTFKSGMKTLGTATDKATDKVNVLGKGVSKGTKSALKNYVKYSEDSTRVMAQIKNNNGKVTKEMQEQLINATRKGGEEAVKQVKSRNKKISNQLNDMLKDSKAFTQSEKDDMIAKNQEASDEKVRKLESLNDEIAVLEEKQFTDGKLTDSESAKLKSKLDERNKLTIKYLSQGQKEQQAILSRLNANTGALDTQEAADAIKDSIKARNKAIKEAKKQRTDDTIEADSLLGSGAISKKEHEKRIKEINKQYNKTKKEADKKASEIKGNIKKNNDDIDSEIDMSTGKVYTGAEKWWKEYTNGVRKRFNESMESVVDFGGWIMDVKEKADNFWSQFGSAFSQTMSDAWSGLTTNAGNFGSMFIDSIMNIGSWIMDVKNKANSFWNQFGTAFTQGASNVVSAIGGWFSQQGSEFANRFKQGWQIASQAGADLWSWIKQTGAGIGGWFAQQGREFWSALKNGWSNAIAISGDIWSSIKQTGANIGAWFSQKGSQLWSSMKSGWNNAINTTGDLWNSLTTWLGSKWGLTKQWFITKGSNMWSSIKQGWNNLINTDPGALWRTLTTALGTAWAATKQWFITKGKQMGSAISTGWSAMKGFVVSTFSAIWTSVKVIWRGIWSTISYWAGAIWNRVKSVWSWIKTNTVGAFTFVWSTVKRIWTGIKNTIVYWTQAIWNRIKSVWSWIKTNTLGAFNYVWSTIKRIWKGIKDTIVYWTTAIWNRVKSVWNWIKSNTASAFTWVWNKIKSIWKGIKDTITYWTSAIWNRVKSVWNWIKSNTASAFTWVWNKIKSIWKGIKGTITYWTNAIWNKVKSIWNSIKTHTSNIFNAIWNKLKSIWSSIFGTIKYWMNQIWNKVKNGWNSIKKHTVDMVTQAKNSVVDKFKGMYDGAKKWVDSIGSYIDDAKKWMKDKAVSLGTSVANGAISGLNGMIGGINKISKAITSKKLMDEIKPLHTGTSRGKPKSNSKGQLKQPTTAVVNDRGRGNGQGRNGHQEVIQKANGSMYAPRGKDVVVGLGKGDIVHSGQETQAMQSQGIIPHFASGTKKKKNQLDYLKEAAGGAVKETGKKIGDGYHSSKKGVKDAGKAVKAGGEVVLDKGKDAAGWLGDKIGDVMDYVKNPGKLVSKMMAGISFGKENKTMEMAGLAFSSLKKSLVEKVKSMFEEAGGGDGDAAWLLKHQILQTFGHYTGGLMFNGGRHYGVDFGMPTGTSIKALTGGKITQAGPVAGGGGNQVTLEEPGGKWFQWYMHMSKILTKKGAKVNAGDEIGKSGNTGNSTTPHLHIQRMKGYPSNETAVDPMKWLKSLKGGGQKKAASKWAPDIKRAASEMKVGLRGNDLKNIISLIQAESGGDAGITQGNIGDINNRNGNPAQGLLQYIPQTFASYAMKGKKNIKNGYHQLLAFFNNKNWRTQFNPNGGWSPSGPRRFAHGGMIKKHGLYEAGEGNREEMILPLTNKVRAMQLIDQAKSFMGVDDEGSISSVQNTSNDSAMVQVMEQNNKLLEMLIGVVQDKELVVDKNSIVETANNGLGRMHRNKKYTKGGY